MAEVKEKTVEDHASDAFNALPFEERKRICRFMNMERIRELQRQNRKLREAIEDNNEAIKRTREWMSRECTSSF